MMLCMQLLQSRRRHMGINLRGGQVTMPKQQLHATQVSAMIEQMRGKSVT